MYDEEQVTWNEPTGPCKQCGYEDELNRHGLCGSCRPPMSDEIRSALTEAMKPKIDPWMKRYATVGAYLGGQVTYQEYWEEVARYILSTFKVEAAEDKTLPPLWWLASATSETPERG